MKSKIVVSLSIVFLILFAAFGWWNYGFHYSEGVRCGFLSSFAEDGWIPLSGEGELQLGKNSNPVRINETGESITPWMFSSSVSFCKENRKFIGSDVYICYYETFRPWPFRETTYTVTKISNMEPKLPIGEKVTVPHSVFDRKDGMRVGRIVKVSTRGQLVKTWEVVFQVGEGGSQFMAMSVDNDEIANFLQKCVKSGQLIKIAYIDKGVVSHINFQDTRYRICYVEIMQ